jgi:hypothetical protein
MLWWALGLWLLSPALVPIFWLLGLLTRPQGIGPPQDLRSPIDNQC